MNKLYTYIALLLAGIFSFSISSQAIHVLWHSSRMHTECHHDDHNHVHAHSHETSDHSDEYSLQFDEHHEHCFICEFEFSIAEEPGLFIPELVSPQSDFFYILKDNTRPSVISLNSKSSRAPPVIIF